MHEPEPSQAHRRVEALSELLEAAFDTLDEGMAVLDADACVAFWNSAATDITGYQRAGVIARPCPPGLYLVDRHRQCNPGRDRVVVLDPAAPADPAVRPVLVNLRHQQGHSLPVMLRRTPLRDGFGARFGALLRFHPAEDVDALPHGESGEGVGVECSRGDLENRLDEAFRDWRSNGVPFGLLWISVDQAALLRRTHGRDACEAMLAVVERTLTHGLRPMEILGRWGDNEFLVLSHERTAEMLSAHAQHLAGLARTADFRWWGDRVSLTVSIGAAQAAEGVSLSCLVRKAQKAMEASMYAGGNHITTDRSGDENREKNGDEAGDRSQGPGGEECSQF